MVAKRDTVSRFVEKFEVDPISGCWNWSAGLGTTGYGQFNSGQSRAGKAHRFAYELWVGPIPNGMNVCHRCDNPPCINPDHLFIGTLADNNLDCRVKGRHKAPCLRGTDNPAAVLTEEDVNLIRSLYIKGSRDFGCVGLGQRFGVSYGTIFRIINNETWKGVI